MIPILAAARIPVEMEFSVGTGIGKLDLLQKNGDTFHMISFRGGAERCRVLLVLAFVVVFSGCASFQKPNEVPAVPEILFGIPAGYLSTQALPNSLALIPTSPASGSTALALDEEVSRTSLALRGMPRWNLAAEDANLKFPQAANAFSCSLNAPITVQDTPHLYMLMRRTLVDAGFSTHLAKEHYMRTRPFVVNGEPTCTPLAEGSLRKNGSYPSGHAAIGWAWALILSEIAPEQADAILARGRAFGQSRVICNVHWQSDVIEGRFLGAATVAILHADFVFRADLESAKAELATARGKGLKPTRDWEAEAKELAQQPPPAP